MAKERKVALIHDWLTGMRGGEKVLEILCELYPDAPIYTLVHERGKVSPIIERHKIITSFLQKMPYATTRYQYYLPLFPTAIEQFDLSEFDLVISSSHAAAKGVRVKPGATHVCYCYTPMRYIWDQFDNYFGSGRSSLLARLGMKFFRLHLQKWDVRSSKGVTQFIAISETVRERIQRIYTRESIIIYPPVDINRFAVSEKDDGYFLIVSALVPYKRIDIAVDAFNKIGKPLRIIGTGSEMARLKKIEGKNISFEGWQSDERIAEAYAGCTALIFPGEEDFGIVPVEAMASGKPVIAFGKGGVSETVVDGRTGILFPEQSSSSLIAAVEKFQSMKFDGKVIREHTMRFDRAKFTSAIQNYLDTP
ncbi:MAG TPA: glycosyltransferase [Bacteroidota bacterium]|nr:glycosyltransferase [Bacteroidota bacterium]